MNKVDFWGMMPAESKISEAVMVALDQHKTENVTSILAHYGDDRECFMLESIPVNSPMESHGEYFEVKLKTDAPGYVLTALLNIDFEAVAEILKDLKWETTADELFDPPVNFNEIYARLLSVSDVFGFYLPTEWNACINELDVGDAMAKLKAYISFCERRKLPYNGPFFTFAVSIGFWGVLGDDIFVQARQKSFFEDLFEYGRSSDLDKIYDVFTKNLNPNVVGINSYILEPEEGTAYRLEKLAMISFKELSDRGKVIRKCQNCGKYFVPTKRSDTLYCDNPSPNAPEMTCKEYGTRRLWYEKQKEDELATLARKIASAKGMLAKRNPDIPGYAAAYSYFKEQRLIWKKAVKDGTKSRDEYREWLLTMQNQKTL